MHHVSHSELATSVKITNINVSSAIHQNIARTSVEPSGVAPNGHGAESETLIHVIRFTPLPATTRLLNHSGSEY